MQMQTPANSTVDENAVRVAVKAAALNHRDLYEYDDPDSSHDVALGSDGAGIVEAVGDGVTTVRVGDEVIINPSLYWGDAESHFGPDYEILGVPTSGTLSHHVTVPAENLFRKPKHLTFQEAAGLPLAGLTAYRALFSRGQLQPGERVLVHGIGGGVALFALQFAVAAGARVAVTSTRNHKLERAVALGAQAGFNSKSVDWVAEATAWSGGDGVDLVIDAIGGEYISRSLDVVCPGGRIVNLARTAGREATINVSVLFWKQISLLGTTMGSPSDFRAMMDFVDHHQVVPVIDKVYGLDGLDSAFAHMRDAKQFGKIVIEVDS